MTTQKLHGVIQGNTIELDRPIDLPSGTPVTVTLTAEEPKLAPGEGLRLSAGAWKGDDEEGLDAYLEWCRQQRQQSGRGPIEP